MGIEPDRTLGRTGVKVSPLTLGTMNFGRWTDEATRASESSAPPSTRVTVIDTADVYGQGESEADRRQGDRLPPRRRLPGHQVPRPGRRQPTARGQQPPLDRQRGRGQPAPLGTDHLDLYQAHRPDPDTDLLETLQTLDGLVRRARSCTTARRCSRPTNWSRRSGSREKHGLIAPHTEQLPYSLLVRGAGTGDLRRRPPVRGRHPQLRPPRRRLAVREVPHRRRTTRIRPRRTDPRAGSTSPSNTTGASSPPPKPSPASPRTTASPWSTWRSRSRSTTPAVSSVIIGPRTFEHLEAYLKAVTVALDAGVLDRVDEIVAPGTQFLERDTGVDTPSLQPAALRRAASVNEGPPHDVPGSRTATEARVPASRRLRARPARVLLRAVAEVRHRPPVRTQREIMLHAFDLGITHFDNADRYGPPHRAAQKRSARSSPATSSRTATS